MTEKFVSAVRSVAVIGTGRMGGHMARNLLRASFVTHIYDPVPELMAPLIADGAAAAASPADAARAADVVITMLPTDEILREVVLTPGGLIEVLQPAQVLVDMGTSRLATVRELAALLADKGVLMLDAPVSGGEVGARDGTMVIMAGGERAAFERCQPVFSAVGKAASYIGGSGMGLVTKMTNQMIVEAAFCGIAEGFALAAKAGADIEAVYNAIRGGMAGSRVLEWIMPNLLSGELGTGHELALHHKDNGFALAAVEAVDGWSPLMETVHNLIAEACAMGFGSGSVAGVARVYEKRLGVKIIRG